MIVLADSVDITLSLAILWHPSYYEAMTTGTKSAAQPRQTKSHPYKALPAAFICSAPPGRSSGTGAWSLSLNGDRIAECDNAAGLLPPLGIDTRQGA